VKKKFPGSFCQTELHDVLQKTGKNKVVIVGYMAHVCVSTTAREASQHGYDVLIAKDAIGDRDIPGASGDEVTEMVCHELGDAFGTIITSADVQ
jgi:nicotinamidase-related amidase